MNKKYFIAFIAMFALLFCTTEGKAIQNNDSLLYEIQNKINRAFLTSFQENGVERLSEIENRLMSLPDQNRITAYWIAYVKYYKAIYYSKFKESEQCHKELAAALDLLEKVKDKDSEIYVLFSMIQSFSIPFSDSGTVVSLAEESMKNAERAIELDSSNLRAWYILASNDYYKPSGGQKCEEYLLKAVSLDGQKTPNPFMPDWGKSDAYNLLIALYINRKDYSRAKEYLNVALSLYPHDYMINQHVKTLKNNGF